MDRMREDIGVSEEIELDVQGMTCASCAARVEKMLNRQGGVTNANVNFAANRASVTYYPQSVSLDELSSAVEHIGYRIAPAEPEDVESEDVHARDQRAWLRRVFLSWPLGLAVLGLSLFYMDQPWARRAMPRHRRVPRRQTTCDPALTQ